VVGTLDQLPAKQVIVKDPVNDGVCVLSHATVQEPPDGVVPPQLPETCPLDNNDADEKTHAIGVHDPDTEDHTPAVQVDDNVPIYPVLH
jgi:hypothetical protein